MTPWFCMTTAWWSLPTLPTSFALAGEPGVSYLATPISPRNTSASGMRHDGISACDGKGGGVRRMRMDAALGSRLAPHDSKMGQGFARAHPRAGKLFAVEVDEAHVGRGHEALADEGRGAKHEVVADADGDVAAVAVRVFALPEALSYVAHPLLQRLNGRRTEESLDGGRGLGIAARRPLEFIVGRARLQSCGRRCDGPLGARIGWWVFRGPSSTSRADGVRSASGGTASPRRSSSSTSLAVMTLRMVRRV